MNPSQKGASVGSISVSTRLELDQDKAIIHVLRSKPLSDTRASLHILRQCLEPHRTNGIGRSIIEFLAYNFGMFLTLPAKSMEVFPSNFIVPVSSRITAPMVGRRAQHSAI